MISIIILGIQVCCDAIFGSHFNGPPSNLFFTVFLNEQSGAQIVDKPTLVLYKHSYKASSVRIELRLEDDNVDLVDNHGAKSPHFTFESKTAKLFNLIGLFIRWFSTTLNDSNSQ